MRVLEVAVIGGGPAGATAARLLAEWGHSVVLLTRPAAVRAPLAESLPPSTRKVLAAVGALDLVEAAGFLPARGNTSWWASDAARVESFPGIPETGGFQVLRADLERLLLDAAQASGVEVRPDARVASVSFEDREVARLELQSARSAEDRLAAAFVLDASGRAGVVARRGFRESAGPPTLAVSAVFRRPGGFCVPDDTHTLVEAYRDGWAWSVPVAKGVRHVTVMLDPRRAGGGRLRPLERFFDQELRKAGHLCALLAGGMREAAPWVADASPYRPRDSGEPRLALAGDAASFIDPLSSYGVKKALASAWLAAVVAHTALRRPERAALAVAFHARRERQVEARYAAESARYAREAAARFGPVPFWVERSRPPSEKSLPRADDEPIAGEAEARAAFEALRGSARLRLRLPAGVRVEPRPAVEGREIALAEALVGPDGHPVHFVGGVNAATLARLAGRAREVGDLYLAYNRAAAPIALPEFLRGLSLVIAAGLLRPALDD